MTEALFLGFLLVFVRCSAMLLSSPVFGAQNTPVPVRIFTTLAISVALTFTVKPLLGPMPKDLYDLLAAVVREAFAGLLIGSFATLATQALQIAGGLMDIQTGLSSSHALNPMNGVQSTVLAQFKFMLGIVVFLCANGHHLLIQAFVKSYRVFPSIEAVQVGYVKLLGETFMIGLQIAAPVLAVGFLVDATLGLMNRAVPQMQTMQVGIPAKVGLGLVAVSVGLPSAVAGTTEGIQSCFKALAPIFGL